MGFELRPYQKEAVDAGLKFLTGRSKKPGIIVAPCGCGRMWKEPSDIQDST